MYSDNKMSVPEKILSANYKSLLTIQKEIASDFNNYFTNVALKLKNEVFGTKHSNSFNKSLIDETFCYKTS